MCSGVVFCLTDHFNLLFSASSPPQTLVGLNSATEVLCTLFGTGFCYLLQLGLEGRWEDPNRVCKHGPGVLVVRHSRVPLSSSSLAQGRTGICP